jgi:hypothetical protein
LLFVYREVLSKRYKEHFISEKPRQSRHPNLPILLES